MFLTNILTFNNYIFSNKKHVELSKRKLTEYKYVISN